MFSAVFHQRLWRSAKIRDLNLNFHKLFPVALEHPGGGRRKSSSKWAKPIMRVFVLSLVRYENKLRHCAQEHHHIWCVEQAEDEAEAHHRSGLVFGVMTNACWDWLRDLIYNLKQQFGLDSAMRSLGENCTQLCKAELSSNIAWNALSSQLLEEVEKKCFKNNRPRIELSINIKTTTLSRPRDKTRDISRWDQRWHQTQVSQVHAKTLNHSKGNHRAMHFQWFIAVLEPTL